MIISISGKIGSGKDTLAKMIQQLQPEKNWQIKKWAYKLKQVASMLSAVPMDYWEDQEFKKQQMPDRWQMTYREFLQRLGTEAMRNGLHQNVWVNALMADYKDGMNWIITDTRFPNEADAVHEMGGTLVRVYRGMCPECKGVLFHDDNCTIGKAEHSSENALDHYKYDELIFNNGTLDHLAFSAKLLLGTE